jgi:hypothetical protein
VRALERVMRYLVCEQNLQNSSLHCAQNSMQSEQLRFEQKLQASSGVCEWLQMLQGRSHEPAAANMACFSSKHGAVNCLPGRREPGMIASRDSHHTVGIVATLAGHE